MAGGAAVDGGMAGFPGDMRGDTGLPQVGNEVGAVITLVGPERQLAGCTRGVAVDHLRRRLALSMTVGLGDLGLHDQPFAVLHQGIVQHLLEFAQMTYLTGARELEADKKRRIVELHLDQLEALDATLAMMTGTKPVRVQT